MTTKQLTITTLIIGLLLNPAATAASTCGASCVTCSNNFCFTCYQTKLVSKQCTTKTPNCDINFNGQEDACGWCAVGYSYDYSTKTCTKLTTPIANCRVGITFQKKNYCGLCQDSLAPSPDYTACLAPQTPIANCLWFALGPKKGPYCFKCAAGYLSILGKSCMKTTALPGCLIGGSQQKVCQMCDPWSGYGQVASGGGCTKGSGLQMTADDETIGEGFVSDMAKKIVQHVISGIKM